MSSWLIRPAKRSERVEYAIRDIVLVAREAQKAGREILYLNIGDPNQFDFETPNYIIEAACKAMRDQHNCYAPSEGLPAALEAIRKDAIERKRIQAVQNVFTGAGCSECAEVALSALVQEGDEVLLPRPAYPLYPAMVGKFSATPVYYDLREETGWQPDIEELERSITSRTRAVVVINPNNPTGSVCPRETLEGIVELARRHRLVVFADEVYDSLLLDGRTHIALGSLADDVPMLTFNGLSKAFMSPGLRLGWCVVSGPKEPLAPYIEAMHRFLRARLCANHPVQYAVVAALEAGFSHTAEVIRKLESRRDLAMRLLDKVPGIACVPPEASFFAFPRLTEPGIDDAKWVRDLAFETGVVVVPGSGFGQAPGTAHFRLVFLPPEPVLARAMGRIDEFVARRGKGATTS